MYSLSEGACRTVDLDHCCGDVDAGGGGQPRSHPPIEMFKERERRSSVRRRSPGCEMSDHDRPIINVRLVIGDL